MTDTPIKKLWSQQTVEERVRTTLRSKKAFIERIDPDDQVLTHHNYENNPRLYILVDENRHFIRILENILEEPATYSPFPEMKEE